MNEIPRAEKAIHSTGKDFRKVQKDTRLFLEAFSWSFFMHVNLDLGIHEPQACEPTEKKKMDCLLLSRPHGKHFLYLTDKGFVLFFYCCVFFPSLFMPARIFLLIMLAPLYHDSPLCDNPETETAFAPETQWSEALVQLTQLLQSSSTQEGR